MFFERWGGGGGGVIQESNYPFSILPDNPVSMEKFYK